MRRGRPRRKKVGKKLLKGGKTRFVTERKARREEAAFGEKGIRGSSKH